MPVFIPEGERAPARFTPDQSAAAGIPTSAPFSLARAGESLAKTGRVALGLDEPQSLADLALQVMGTGKVIGAGGAALRGATGLPAALGRILSAGGLGAGQAAAQGRDVTWGAMLDGIVAGLTEGGAALAKGGRIPFTKLSLKDAGAPARGFEYASRAPREALDLIRSRLPSGAWVQAPTISATPMTPEQAVRRLADMTGREYQMAREEIAREFSRFSGGDPKAGEWFRQFTSESRFPASGAAELAERARRALDEAPLRGGLDALMTADKGGVPLGALGLSALGDSLGGIAERAMRGR